VKLNASYMTDVTWTNLRTLEVLELELLHDFIPNNVGSCKQPATTAGLLVRDGSCAEVDFVIEYMGDRDPCLA